MNDETEEKKDLAYYQARPDEYDCKPNNMVLLRSTGKIVAKFKGAFDITPERRAEMAARRRRIAEIAKMRGLAREIGIDPDLIDFEELADAEGTAMEKIHAHAYKVFMATTSARGLEGLYSRLTSTGEAQTPKEPLPELGSVLASAVIEYVRRQQQTQEPIIEGEEVGSVEKAKAQSFLTRVK